MLLQILLLKYVLPLARVLTDLVTQILCTVPSITQFVLINLSVNLSMNAFLLSYNEPHLNYVQEHVPERNAL
jgi:hypothetical protein